MLTYIEIAYESRKRVNGSGVGVETNNQKYFKARLAGRTFVCPCWKITKGVQRVY
jgi:hypothetical protein